ncbi:MAG: GAF domain-containing protein [Planctomycetaceae bacterium]|nr:GAF domain-containing protein [Planctomycetaceae bacterium]
MPKVNQLQRLLCLSQSEEKDDLLPASMREEYEVTFVRNPVKILSLLQGETFDGVFVCADSFREILGLGELIRDSQILKNLPDAVALLDRDERIVWCNEKLAACTGRSDVSNLRLMDCFPDVALDGSDEDPVHTAAMIGRQTVTRLRFKNANEFDLIVSPVLGRSGKSDQLIVVMRDMTRESQQKQKMNAIHAAGVELANLTPEEIFQWDFRQRIEVLKANILHYTQEVMKFDYFEIRLIDTKTNQLNVLLSVGINSERAQQPLYVSINGQGVTGYVAATGESYYCPNTSTDHLYLDGLIGAGSCLVVPLIVHEHVIGTLNVESPAIDAFSPSDKQFLEIYSYYIANSLNTFELLAAEGANSAQQHIQAIRKAVALPIDEILNEAYLVLEKFSHDPEVEARLRAIVQKTREVKQVIHNANSSVVADAAIPDSLQTPVRPVLVGKRMLVVDHDTTTRDDAHQLLEAFGLIVETAHTGHEALTMMRNMDRDRLYDCILSEERLQDMDACQLLKEMQPIFGVESPPLVLMKRAGFYDPVHVMSRAREAGLRKDARIVKPLRMEQAVAMVERMIDENGHQEICS